MNRFSIFENMEDIRECLTEYLERKNLRKTSERYTILKEIYNINQHFDIDYLYYHMKSCKYIVSKGTLYNTIEILVDCGLVNKHLFDNNRSNYEKAYHIEPHEHIILNDTKEIIEFSEPSIKEIIKKLEKKYNIKILSHSLVFYANKNLK